MTSCDILSGLRGSCSGLALIFGWPRHLPFQSSINGFTQAVLVSILLAIRWLLDSRCLLTSFVLVLPGSYRFRWFYLHTHLLFHLVPFSYSPRTSHTPFSCHSVAIVLPFSCHFLSNLLPPSSRPPTTFVSLPNLSRRRSDPAGRAARGPPIKDVISRCSHTQDATRQLASMTSGRGRKSGVGVAPPPERAGARTRRRIMMRDRARSTAAA